MTVLSGMEVPGPERPPRAVVGSQISTDEEMFGAAFDGKVIRRFLAYVYPSVSYTHLTLPTNREV